MAREILTSTETAQLLRISVRTVLALISGNDRQGQPSQLRGILPVGPKFAHAKDGDLAFPVAPNESQRLAA